MTLTEYQNQLTKQIESAIGGFNKQIPSIEREALNKVLVLVKEIEVKNGQIVNSAGNLKKIGRLRSEMEASVINEKFTAAMQEFVNAFDKVSGIQKKYFGPMQDAEEMLKELQLQSKRAVIEKMTKEIDVRIIPAVEEILRTNITSGGSYRQLLTAMQDYIIGSGNIPGSFGKLSNLAATLTTDALNNFSRQYSQTITQGLGLRWRIYTGSNLTSTREFCIELTKKTYIFDLELPDIAKGIIDGKEVTINPKTKLWYGAKEGTNAANIELNCGGWKCGHQMTPVAEIAVPVNIRIATYNKFGIKHTNGKIQ